MLWPFLLTFFNLLLHLHSDNKNLTCQINRPFFWSKPVSTLSINFQFIMNVTAFSRKMIKDTLIKHIRDFPEGCSTAGFCKTCIFSCCQTSGKSSGSCFQHTGDNFFLSRIKLLCQIYFIVSYYNMVKKPYFSAILGLFPFPVFS